MEILLKLSRQKVREMINTQYTSFRYKKGIRIAMSKKGWRKISNLESRRRKKVKFMVISEKQNKSY